MKRKPGIGVTTGIALAVVLLGFLMAVTYRNTRRLIEAGAWVDHTRDVIGELESLSSSLRDAESSERGYLLTGIPEYLEPYQSCLATIPSRFNRLTTAMSDNPRQQLRLAKLRDLVVEKLRMMQDSIAERDHAGLEGAAQSVAAGAGQLKTDEIRALIGEIETEERALLQARTANSRGTARTAVVSLSIGALILLACLILIWSLIRLDLTKRRAAEDELRRSEAELRTTLRSIGDAVIATDRDARITFMNPIAERLTGWSEKEAVGRDSREVFRILHESTRAEVESPITKALHDGTAGGLISGTILLSRDGAERPISAMGAPIRDEKSKPSGGVLVFRDITEKRQAERDLQQFAAIVSSSEDAIVGEALDGTITSWNAAAERLFGYSASEVIGRSIDLLEPPRPEDSTGVTLLRIRKGERVQQYDTTRKRKDGERVSVSITVSPILDAKGRILGSSRIIRDIGERKRAEVALRASSAALETAKKASEEANQAKDHFLATLSHELRTPLTPALTSAQLLERRTDLPPRFRPAIELIRRSIELEALLVDDLLDLTKIARGKIELRRESVDLHSIIQNVADICRSDILNKHQTLVLDLRATEHHSEADAARIQQVLWNLIKNSVKFTPDGGSITIRTENPESKRIRISIVDTGVGIPPDLLARIFQPFEQGPNATLPRHGGLGLGLSISKTLVELHGGSIHAESEGEDRGSIFTVELAAFLERRFAAAARISDELATRKPLSILAVEDHTDTAQALAQLLDSEGHAVETAGTVADAVGLFRNRPFDLLITDLGLPDGSGYDLLGELRKIRPVRGIVLSGYGMDADIARSISSGFDEHLIKPVNIRRLIAAISRIAQEMGTS
ncbi:MAG TPA: PAS domain S-box protein [Thermoanaerobaculia bacterium]